jgi:hypothetical protein
VWILQKCEKSRCCWEEKAVLQDIEKKYFWIFFSTNQKEKSLKKPYKLRLLRLDEIRFFPI